ncbi:hypothetical protein Pmani_006886 [Petrolisthes manimaculis]|uniref:Uncharacterized protein n=1 Tax=Petrolisthes manimaculis TaxID=1843537 RepID=A0AAE1QBP9_9EUCA|nr:hypothetical protein Pmani_006886 [Petrolisthes manimaculis]
MSQPEPGTYNIVSVHHEFMSVLKKIVMVLYRDTINPFFIPTLYCTGKSCRIYPVLKAVEGGLSVPTPNNGAPKPSMQAALARLSTVSFPASPIWEGIHTKDKTSEELWAAAS